MSEGGPEPTAWRYEPAQNIDKPLTERLRHFPREPEMTVYGLRSIAALFIRAWLRIYHRLEITGRENLPAESSFVMVANHSSHLDALCLLAALPLKKLHRAFPAAAVDYFFQSVPRTWMAAIVVNALPFARQVQIRQSLSLCEGLLANPGNVLILFPEGTRSSTGQMNAFKPGIGLLLAGQTVPVLPCYLTGAFRAWGKGRILPKPTKLRLAIGAPRNYATFPSSKESACAIAADLQRAVQMLKGASAL
jgi:1-acyl-sn-glycerol-3-phosphate acyltransferase